MSKPYYDHAGITIYHIHRGWVSRLDAGQTGVWTAASGVCLPCKRAKRRHAVEEATNES